MISRIAFALSDVRDEIEKLVKGDRTVEIMIGLPPDIHARVVRELENHMGGPMLAEEREGCRTVKFSGILLVCDPEAARV